MSGYVALLRAVNLGEGTRVSAAKLRGAGRATGFREVSTVGASGTLVLRGPSLPVERIERELLAALRRAGGPSTECFVRTGAEWAEVVRDNPFPAEARADPAHLTLNVLRSRPSPAAWASLRERVTGRERISEDGRHAYIVYPDGIGRSRLTLALIERTLGTRSTARNWNTVLRLHELLRPKP